MKRYAIIVAGGSGTRMGTEIPKQFIPLRGRPILMHTMEAFYDFDSSMELILVLPEDQFDYWNQLCAEVEWEIPFRLAAGGETRFHSVKNGLALISVDGIVGIHDGVRPFVSKETLERCYNTAAKENSAIPVVPVTDSLRLITENGNTSVRRDDYRNVQTPQCFWYNVLAPCYDEGYRDDFTDDASVYEAAGFQVNLVEGNPENIKITTPKDLKLAEYLLD